VHPIAIEGIAMTAQLNHTIVWCRDNKASARFLAGMLGKPEPRTFSHFQVVELDNGVSMDFLAKDGPIARQHYAFLVDDSGFDAGMARIEAQGLSYWADPARTKAGEINHHWGGRGVYFEDPDGHLLELITEPYGVEEDL
jgi:catechol 2,3-dioxygenase-like lactoylglutathione lyase family enzyme